MEKINVFKSTTPSIEITNHGKNVVYDVPENAPWVVFVRNKMGFYSDLDGRPDKLVREIEVPKTS